MEENRLEENRQLRQKLDKLLKEARRNEQTQTSFDTFSLSVVAAQGPGELFDLLLQQQKKFRIDEIRLCLVDRFHEVERLLTESYQHSYKGLSFIDTETSKLLISDIPNTPVLGTRIINKYDWLINIEDTNKYQSAAILPLKRGDEIIGIQLLLSKDPTRYNREDGTAFLQKLGAMIAISIENCINRQRTLELGYQDGLTNAYNRRYFDERLKHEVDRCVRKKTDLVCLFIDVDFFKQINDRHGHQVGDAVLVRLVALMREQVRSSDIVARYGGEEFAIILPDTGIQLAHEVAERIRSQVEQQKLIIEDSTLSMTVSIGLASLSQIKLQLQSSEKKLSPSTINDLDKMLLGKADQALYQAKQTGRNQVVIQKMAG
ncbi:diguanylate cyclase (GGDEF domain) [hydrothermal vent metagenome]|uniref:Diguanylate cyclase (GGDEF domain) n=1 Tax=hydrothermal vent metagenome TaxID=652676 RepID=A0A3B0WE51_9ZZZZ